MSRRFVSVIRGALMMALVLCTAGHGVPEETHESVFVPAAFSATATATAADKDPHGPHAPHGTEECAADLIVRTAAQPAEELALGAMSVVLLAVSVVAGRPLVRCDRRRRRSARTGRVALVRTSRWRI
ncbi:hypothetical protein ABZ281_13745 [Streptomyces sp. NPDC006265]|uniref:hypothetical protein n=1 Tax=Streptomyces sp. NPDC006265 TaxID=3156740 RepID=UPI0033AC6F3B